jgi:hypothetical protein
MKHKWNRNSRVGVSNCLLCGYCREWVNGVPTYFRNDNLYDKKAPPCDRLIVGKSEAEVREMLPLLF